MTRPWEEAPLRPWEQGFQYPRIIAISRPASSLTPGGGGATAPVSQPGGRPYTGLREPTSTGGTSEPTLYPGLPASIQSLGARAIVTKDAVPSAAPGPIRWKIFIPKSALAKGSVLDRDVVTDDEGSRYIVTANYWNSLGYSLEAVRQEA